MKKVMLTVTVVTAVLTVVCALFPSPLAYSLAITFGTTFYHFAMRLCVGYGIHARFHNRMDYTRAWFQPRPFERRLYRLLRVKSGNALCRPMRSTPFRLKTSLPPNWCR